LLFVLIYLVPLGSFYLLSMAAAVTGRSFNFDLGPAGLLVLPVFAVPLVHLFVSTSRMRRAAEAGPLAEAGPEFLVPPRDLRSPEL
jgi:hypothetical protein